MTDNSKESAPHDAQPTPMPRGWYASEWAAWLWDRGRVFDPYTQGQLFLELAEWIEDQPQRERALSAAQSVLALKEAELAAAKEEVYRLSALKFPSSKSIGDVTLSDGSKWATSFTVSQEFNVLRQRLAAVESALTESVKLQSHYASLLNSWDGGNRKGFSSAEEWLSRLAALTTQEGKS